VVAIASNSDSVIMLTRHDRGVLFANVDDWLCRFGWRLQWQKLETGLSFVCFDPSCGSEPPVHRLLALASRSSDDCLHTMQRVILEGDPNLPPNHLAK